MGVLLYQGRFPSPDVINNTASGVLCSFYVPLVLVAHGIKNPRELTLGENRDPLESPQIQYHPDSRIPRKFHSTIRQFVVHQCKRRGCSLLTRIGEDFVDLFTLLQDFLLISVNCCLGCLYHVCPHKGDNCDANRVWDKFHNQWRSEMLNSPQPPVTRSCSSWRVSIASRRCCSV